jgi:hypothetical protein
LFPGEVAAVDAVIKRFHRFLELAVGESQIAREIGGVVPAESLRYQPWSRRRGAAELILEIQIASDATRPNQIINLQLEFVRSLPRNQVFV